MIFFCRIYGIGTELLLVRYKQSVTKKMISQHQGIQFEKPAFQSWSISKLTIAAANNNPGRNGGSFQLQRQLPAKLNVLPETAPEAVTVRPATNEDAIFARTITDEMCKSALARGCGISRRNPSDIEAKMREGKAIIAVTASNEWVGFSYIETYENSAYVSNSGLIVAPAYRNCGVAKTIKQRVFDLSRKLYPNAKVFSITTGAAVMKMNSRLGFEPVTYGEITSEMRFWEGCKTCVNYQTLLGKNFKNCFCTAMLFNPDEEPQEEETETESEHFK